MSRHGMSTPNERQAFARALKRDTDDLRGALRDGHFAHRPVRLGAELDLWLLAPDGRPAPVADRVLAEMPGGRVRRGPTGAQLTLVLAPVESGAGMFDALHGSLQSCVAGTRIRDASASVSVSRSATSRRASSGVIETPRLARSTTGRPA